MRSTFVAHSTAVRGRPASIPHLAPGPEEADASLPRGKGCLVPLAGCLQPALSALLQAAIRCPPDIQHISGLNPAAVWLAGFRSRRGERVSSAPPRAPPAGMAQVWVGNVPSGWGPDGLVSWCASPVRKQTWQRAAARRYLAVEGRLAGGYLQRACCHGSISTHPPPARSLGFDAQIRTWWPTSHSSATGQDRQHACSCAPSLPRLRPTTAAPPYNPPASRRGRRTAPRCSSSARSPRPWPSLA
jgi:hypothetical protein